MELYAPLYPKALGSSPVTDFPILFLISFLICCVIELYRIGFKRWLDIQSVYRFNFNFVLHLNKTGVGKKISHDRLLVDVKHSIVFIKINRP